MKHPIKFIPAMLGVSLLLGVGCADHAAVRPAESALAHPAPTPKPAPTPAYSGPTLSVSSDIMSACKIVLGNVDRAPKFDFDRSELLARDRDVLDQVGKCVKDGPLEGHTLKLIGRADPRGELEYNFALGEHRANSVQSYLSDVGVDKDHLVETSRGKLDATGTDEAGWQRDRRVDIVLVK